MKTLSKLKRVNRGILIDIFNRSLIGFYLAIYFSDMVKHPFKEQVIFFVQLAIITVIIEHGQKFGFRTKKVSIDGDVLTLFKAKFSKPQVEYIKYELTNKFTHTIRIKLKGYLPQDFAFTSPDFIEDMRLFNFIKENFLPVTLVEELLS